MIIIVSGLPATGKSFFSNELSAEIEAIHLNTDKIREQIGKKGEYDKQSKQQVYNELKFQARKNLEKGENVIVDGTFHKKKRRNEFKELAREMKKPFYLIEMKSSEKTIERRLKEKRQYSEADYKVYKKLKNEYEPPSMEHLVLRNDEEDINELIEITKKYIQAGKNE